MAYIGKSPTGTGVRSRFYYTQTSGGGTSISGTDDNSKTLTFTDGEYIDVYLNGVLLVAGTDYNTNTANTISGLAALANGDVVEVVVYDIFTVADTVSASQGGTFNAGVTMSDGLTVDDDGAAPLTVDRATSNGDVITLQKNGSTVGSVGVTADGAYIAGKTDTALFLNDTDDNIYTITTGLNNRDNTTDLGRSNARFKDLYLGGNLYIGGTGSANALDDYEEGTFTATLNGGSNHPSTRLTTTGQYTKVGNKVTVSFEFNNVTTTGSPNYAGLISVFGMPFASSNPSGTVRQVSGNVGMYQMGSWSGGDGIWARLDEGSTEWKFFVNETSTTWNQISHSAGTNRYLLFNATYIVA